jgi:protein phosphatase
MVTTATRRMGGSGRRALRLRGEVPSRGLGGSRGGPGHADGGVHQVNFTFPDLSLIVLIGASGSGKSTFAAKHFLPTEVLSSDFCGALVSDHENNQAATGDAFEILHFIAGKRLAAGKLTVVDATNVRPEDRKPLVTLARSYHCLPVAIVFNISEKTCQQ